MLFFMTVFTKIDFLNVLLETIQEFRFFDNYLIGMKRLINPVNFNIQNTMFMPLQIGINSFTSLVMNVHNECKSELFSIGISIKNHKEYILPKKQFL